MPSNTGVDVLGNALARASGWNSDDAVDGAIVADASGQPRAFIVAFRKPFPLPPVGLSFLIGSSQVTVTRVMRQPANVNVTASAFP